MALVLGMPAMASADTITQMRPFNLSFGATFGGGGTATVLLFDRFDASLGTLDRVDVAIDASLVMQLLLPASFLVGPFGVPVPIGYTYDIRTSLDFGGQASDFSLTPEVILTGGAPGGVTPIQLVATAGIQHAFSYTATTDLVGFTPVDTAYSPVFASLGSVGTVPPALSSGERQDFVAPVANVPLPVTPTLLLSAPVFAGALQPDTFTGTVAAVGRMAITYTFTPTPAPVPEPGVSALVGGGLLALAARRRRRP